ncbi:MAG: gamma-glutamyltransferase, partial [Pseudobdellovibrionaceae bacterium]
MNCKSKKIIIYCLFLLTSVHCQHTDLGKGANTTPPSTQAAQAPASAGPVQSQPITETLAPEVYKKSNQALLATAVQGQKFMAVTPHPLATQAAVQILQQGGSAVDAALAAQIMLTLVEPAASGIGGGAFMLVYDAKNKQVRSFDGRETAPAAVTADMFLDAQQKPQDFFAASVGGKSVGVPGFVYLASQTHQLFGRVSWSQLWQPTIEASLKGFPVSARFAYHLKNEKHLQLFADSKKYFFAADGTPWPEGHWLKNPQLAQTLQILAGSKANKKTVASKLAVQAFYDGALSQKIRKA